MKVVYQLPISKSDDLLYHYQDQQSPVKLQLKESYMRQNSVDEVRIDVNQNRHDQKKVSYQSMANTFEQQKCRRTNIKKKVLAQIAQMGSNVFLAEYLFNKNLNDLQLNEQEDCQAEVMRLIDVILEKIEEIEREQKQQSECCSSKKKIQSTNSDYKFQRLELQKVIPINIEDEIQIFEQCGICRGEMINRVQLLKCKHAFCLECIQGYLINQIQSANVLEIYCPQDQCKTMYTEEIISGVVTSQQFEKYKDFKLKKKLESDETVRWCVKPGCDQFVKGNIFSKVVFCKCGQGICYDCRREAHEGLTCDQALDKYYEQMLKNLIIQKCPKCKAPIQKKEGCNHITCYQCRFQFCWICRARYTRMHFDSDNCFGCPDKQFSSEDPSYRPLWKKYGGILFELFASLFMLPFLPFILIYYAIMGPLKIMKKVNRTYYRGMSDEERLCYILMGFFCSPLLIVLEIFPGSLLLLFYKLRYD